MKTGCSLVSRLFHCNSRRLSSICTKTFPVPNENLDFIPRSIFERLKSSPNEIDPALFDDKQVELSQREIKIGKRWNLLNLNNSNPPSPEGYFKPNEWIQLLTHATYFNGIAVNNAKFAILGEPLVHLLINTNSNLFTNTTANYSTEENSISIEPRSDLVESSYKFLNRTSHLGSSIHIAHRMRYMGITGIIRCHRNDHSIREPSLKIIQTVFHAIVGGIYIKIGLEGANEFIKQILTFKIPKEFGK